MNNLLCFILEMTIDLSFCFLRGDVNLILLVLEEQFNLVSLLRNDLSVLTEHC